MTTFIATACTGLAIAGVSPDALMDRMNDVIAQVRPEADPMQQTAKGTIKSIDAEKNTFVLENEKGTTDVTLNEKTIYTFNGEESTRDEALKVGRSATVVHTDGVATKVEVTVEK